MCDYEPQYEPSIADEILSNATAKLIAAIKGEAAEHFKKLEADNKRLKRQNAILRKAEARVCEREAAVMLKQKELEKKARRMTVKEFFGQRSAIMYKVERVATRKPKCSKCNAERIRYYTTPLGNKAYELCTCAGSTYSYVPMKVTLYELKKRQGELLMWFKPLRGEYGGYGSGVAVRDEAVYTPRQQFDSLSKHNTHFASETDCQAYCDWLNEQEQGA